MKNKIISALLLSMSVSVAVPGAAIYASEDTAMTETDAFNVTDENGEVAEEPVEETEGIDKVAQMEAYSDDAAAKASDSPEGFANRLAEVVINSDVFGTYAEELANYISGGKIDKSNLYDAEIAAANKAEVLMVMESEDAVNAAKYHIALAFEATFGENAFNAGRDIRRSIDLGKDEMFAECTVISDLNSIYAGVTNVPAAYLPVVETEEVDTTNENVSTQADENLYIGETDMTEAPDETEAQTEDQTEAQTEAQKLSTYVSNINDVTITVGGAIQNPVQILDPSKVASVTLNANSVNINVAGTYVITYIITGTDGSTETVDKNCTVEENDAVKILREQMRTKVDEMGADLTLSDIVTRWESAAAEAKNKINALSEDGDMQAVLDNLQVTHDSLLAEQQLSIAKTGYVSDFDAYCAGFDFKTETEKNAVAAIRVETVDNINNAATVQDAANALAEGKKKVDDAAGSLDAVKESAKKTIDSYYSNVSEDTTTISQNVYAVITSKLSAAESTEVVESIVNTASHVFTDIKNGLDGAMTGFDTAYADMKGLSGEADTTETIGLIISRGATTDLEDAEYRILDTCKALTQDVANFCEYLSSRVGVTINETTKVEAYTAFLGNYDNNELSNAKKSASDEVQTALDAIDVSDSTALAEEKTALATRLMEMIEASASVDEVEAAKASALEEINAFKTKVDSSVELEKAKTNAKNEMNNVINAQTAAALRDSLFSLAKTYTTSIDAATTSDEVSSILAQFKTNADTVVKKYAEDQGLATVISETLTKIEQLQNGIKSEYVTSDMTKLISNAKTNVQNATSANECNTIYNNLKTAYNNAYLSAMRSAYVTKTQSLLSNASLTGDTYKTQASSVVAKQVENINSSTSEDAMKKCYELAQKQITQLEELQKSETELTKAKEDAVSKLKSEYPSPSDNQSKILESYYTKINNATSTDEVNKLVTECETSMKSNSDTSGVDSAAKLQEAKTSALEYIKEMYDSVQNNANVSSTDKEGATTIYNNYKAAIEAATTVNDVNTLKEKCATELEKYGANRPTPNDNTSTTAGTNPGTDASAKGDTVTSTGKVQTGDNNLGVMATAISAISAAMAAMFFSIRKLIIK